MAQHLTQAAIQTLLAKTLSNCKPFEINNIVDAMSRTSYVRAADGDPHGVESTLATIFPSAAPNP